MIVDRVVFPEAAAVLPLYTRDASVVLLKQYRPVVNNYIIEAPAGVVDPGEAPEDTARRELEEEAGLIAGELVRVARGYVSPGYSTEVLHLFLAPDPSVSSARPEAHEIIEVVRLGLDDALNMVREGTIRDVKTVLLLFAAKLYIDGELLQPS
jgi:ADP-ribose pyrophosphatase